MKSVDLSMAFMYSLSAALARAAVCWISSDASGLGVPVGTLAIKRLNSSLAAMCLSRASFSSALSRTAIFAESGFNDGDIFIQPILPYLTTLHLGQSLLRSEADSLVTGPEPQLWRPLA